MIKQSPNVLRELQTFPDHQIDKQNSKFGQKTLVTNKACPTIMF